MVEKPDDETDRSRVSDCGGCENDSCLRAVGSGPHRRNLLRLMAGGASVSLAGCTSLFAFGDEPEPRERPAIGTETEDGGPDAGGNETDGDGASGETATATADETESYNIRYIKQGETIEVPADKSLLVAGEDQGWDLPFNCRRGVCGQCTARLWGDARDRVELEGNEVLSEEELADGFTLTCVGYPRSDFVMETGEVDALEDRVD